jgi:hypothetical protein
MAEIRAVSNAMFHFMIDVIGLTHCPVDLNIFVGQLTPRQKVDPAVRHALDTQRALSMGNYHALFGLYMNAPNMGAYIMDHFIDRERIKALMVMTKASVTSHSLIEQNAQTSLHHSYKTLPLSFIYNELAFETPAAAREFLVAHSAGFFMNPNSPDTVKILDCKPAGPNLGLAFDEKFRKVGIKGALPFAHTVLTVVGFSRFSRPWFRHAYLAIHHKHRPRLARSPR